MCGIAGIWATQPISDASDLAARLETALAHRGPDGAGHVLLDERRLLLVHRRLAVIDTSKAAAQPMATPDGRHTLVFNGEIYNHAALRKSLESEGERFFTASDTEVLLRLLARRGVAALADVRGMFAFAWWNAGERSLVIARDRFGIKPCYWSAAAGRVGFASEVDALRAAGFDNGTDPAGVLAYLRWGAIPAPLSWASGIHALEPGTFRRWSRGDEIETQFADARELWRGDSQSDVIELHERTRAALRSSVDAHLVADVPVGLFLSGGIDSAALVATMDSCGVRPRTFTVVFSEATHDESAQAALIARHFNTDHHTLHVDARTVIDQMPAILDRMDQPTVDGINTYVVSGAVASSGIKAVLSGIGGDELFGGYPSFRRMTRGASLRALPRQLRVAAGKAFHATRREWRTTKLAHALEHADAPFELYRALRGWMMPSEIALLAGPRLRDRAACVRVNQVEQQATACDWPEMPHATVARLESTMYMRQQLLRDADVMSMAHGLEVRVPFVDHELIGAVWPAIGRHPHLLAGKKLLVDSLSSRLPDAIVSRPKRGFTLPFERWIDGALGDFVADGLASAARGGWIAADAPRAVTEAWKAGTCHWSRPWGLAVLGHFLEG